MALLRQVWEANLEKMKTLEKGWDSYKADPPTPESIELARSYLELSPHPNRCVPTAMGGVALTYRKKHRKAFIEFYNKGMCKIAVLLADGVAMNVVKADAIEPILEAVNKYTAEVPVLTRKEIEEATTNAALDFLVAKWVFDFPGLGYYRRKSAYDNTHPCHEPCEKGDVTPDMPEWKADAKYYIDHWLRVVNPFSTSPEEAHRVMQMMLWASELYTKRFINYLTDNGKEYGVTDVITFSTALLKGLEPKKIALAALYAIAETVDDDEDE